MSQLLVVPITPHNDSNNNINIDISQKKMGGQDEVLKVYLLDPWWLSVCGAIYVLTKFSRQYIYLAAMC